jgi:hypothetical protein
MNRCRVVLIAMVSLLLPLVEFAPRNVSAQAPSRSVGGDSGPAPLANSRTFGTASATAYVIGASEFEPDNSSCTWSYTPPNGVGKFATCPMRAWVRLPAGSIVQSIELEACDTATDRDIEFFLVRQASPAGLPLLVTPNGSTGVADTPGCGFFSIAPLPAASPLIIDNADHTYGVHVDARTNTTAVTAVRIYYTLQVSPAPGTARFNDVPTNHTFFQFIEALAAAGITGGCSTTPPLYCPDDPVTRGQMAVFIGRALGLHFAP